LHGLSFLMQGSGCLALDPIVGRDPFQVGFARITFA
jgi:hypothetical protein